MKKILFTKVLLFALVAFSNAQIFTEQFEYTTNTALDANGWDVQSTGGSTPNPITVSANSLTFSQYSQNSIGGSAVSTGNGQDVNKFFGKISNGSVYASFLLKVDTIGSSGYFFHFMDSAGTSNYRARTFFQLDANNSSAYNLGLAFNSGTGVFDTTEFLLGDTILVVAKYTIISGSLNDQVSLFAFKKTGSFISEPTTPLLGPFTGTSSDIDPARIALRQFNSSNDFTVDAFSISTTWNMSPTFTLAQIDLPITWDDTANVDYTVTDFGGDSSTVVISPTTPGNMVLETIKSNTAQSWAGTTLSTPIGLASAIPFSAGNTSVSVAIWSPDANIPVRLKAEDNTDPTKSVETETMTSVANAWDTLVFDFSNQVSGTAVINFSYTYDKLSIFYNFGTTGATAGTKTYYCDNVFFGGAASNPTLAQIDLPITWDDTANVNYTVTDFGGDSSTVVVDPTTPGNLVLETIKSNTAQTWAGTTLSTPMGLASSIPFSAGNTFVSVAVWSPNSGIQVRLKAEDHTDPTKSVETEVTTSVANAWDTLVFDFSNQAAGTAAINYTYNYDMLSIFYNFGVNGATAGTKTYYCDDVYFGIASSNPTLAQIDLPITWDDTANVDYTVTDFGGDSSTVVISPTTPGNMVLETIKSNTAQSWAGTTLSTPIGLASAIPFSAGNTSVSVAIWSPDANIPVRLKAEDNTDPTKSVETETMTSVANAWDTLVFDFSNQVSGTAVINFSYTYDKLSIFYNFGTTGATAGTKTYYCDNVFFGGAASNPTLAQIDLPITWDDTANVNYTVTDFGGDSSTVVVDPTTPGNLVLETIKSNTAQTWAGTTLSTPMGLASSIPFSAGNTFVSVAVWSPNSGIQVRLKAEDHTDPTKSVETEVTTSVANAWDTLVFDFSNQAAGTAAINYTYNYDMLSIFYNFGVNGATAGTKTYYCDDVYFGIASSNPTLAQIDLPITWDDTANVDYTVTDFGGDSSTVVISPTTPGNMVLETIKSNTAQSWAGTTLSTPIGLASAIPFSAGNTSVSVAIWSPDANIPVRLKAEDNTDPTKSVETETMTSVANAWDTLVFDFSNQVSGTAVINFSYTYDKLSIFYNFGTTGATAGTKTYYCDNVFFGGAASNPTLAQIDLPITWDDTANVNYTVTDFGGDSSTVVVDPTTPGNLVLETIKSNTAQTWAGTTLSTPMGLASSIPFSAGNTFVSVAVWSPNSGIQVRLKAEDHTDPTKSVETEVTTSVANAWDTLVFDFSNQAAGTAAINYTYNYDMLSIFYNFGVNGATAGTKTYYCDDVYFGIASSNPTLAQIDLPITWDDTANVDYTVTDFGGDSSTVVISPTTPGNMVLETIKSNTAQSWAGTTLSTPIGLASAIPFSAGNTSVSVAIWSPDANIPVRLKAEDNTDPTKSVETETMTSVANAWDTLVFDFSNQVSGTAVINFSYTYDKLSIFYNFGTTGATAGTKTYYCDNVFFGGAASNPTLAQIDLPITWDDTANVNYTVTDFGGDSSTVVVDPTTPGNLVLETIKSNTAQTWAGTTLSTPMGLASSIPFSAGNTFVSVAVWSPNSGIQVRLKAEDHTDPTKSVETEVTTSVANAWDTLVFDFSNQAAGTAAINYTYNYDMLSIFYNFGVNGATAGTKTYYCDDVYFGIKTIGLNEIVWNKELVVSPNPSSGTFNLTGLLNIGSEIDIVVTDVHGKVIYRHSENTASVDHTIFLDNASSGLYVVSVITQHGVFSEKLLITK